MTYKKVKIWIGALVLVFCLGVFSSCNESSTDYIGNWVKLSAFDGVTRGEAVGFTIGTKGYAGTGYNGDNQIRLNDFWEYDASRDTWTQKADLPGVARSSAVGFGTDTKGYIGTGYDGRNRLSDFYEFDPQTNIWTQIADFPGSARYAALAMTINNKGYVGTGYDLNYLKDFWEYDPTTATWTQKASVGGDKRMSAACFVINGKGYVTTGIENSTYNNDLWVYDPNADQWTQLRYIYNYSDESYDDAYTTIEGAGKVGFAINGKGYLATGGKTTGKETWEYDPTTDLWTEKTSFEGATRTDAVGFAIGSRGYVLTGKSGTSTYLDDVYAFDPDAEYNAND